MTARLESRLARLEQHAAPPWRAWIGRPAQEWPDEVLEARICDANGLQPHELTDDVLAALIAEAEASIAAGASGEGATG